MQKELNRISLLDFSIGFATAALTHKFVKDTPVFIYFYLPQIVALNPMRWFSEEIKGNHKDKMHGFFAMIQLIHDYNDMMDLGQSSNKQAVSDRVNRSLDKVREIDPQFEYVAQSYMDQTLSLETYIRSVPNPNISDLIQVQRIIKCCCIDTCFLCFNTF